jgi:hypothetical protein
LLMPPEAGGGAGASEDACHFGGPSLGNVTRWFCPLAVPGLPRVAGVVAAFDWRLGLCCYLQGDSAANRVLTRWMPRGMSSFSVLFSYPG